MVTAQLGTVLRHIQQLAGGGTDRQLLDDFTARRDEAAFAALVARHGPMVFRVCRRVLNHAQDAEDAFQATFLVLARNTRAIRKREALAEFLHGVAFRTALKAKRSAARRRKHEGVRMASAPRTAPAPTWNEVQAALDEELRRLPEPLRAAFVLCVLEGKSGPEAAVELGCQEGTISSRLSRARKLLRERLARRGIALAAVLAVQSLARAAVSPAQAHAAIRVGLLAARGETTRGLIPSAVEALAAHGNHTLPFARTRVVAAVLMALGLCAAGTALSRPARAAPEAEPPAAPARQADAKPTAAVALAGRVVDPDGKTVPGAQVHLVAPTFILPRPLHVETKTGADGDFRLEVRQPASADADTPYWGVYLVAAADGYGPALHCCNGFDTAAGLTLRLARDDVPVHGRILDLQGKPIAGVRVHVDRLGIPSARDLTPWLEALSANKKDAQPLESQFLEEVPLSSLPPLFGDLKTDSEGRFVLRGVGRERVAHLQLEGPTTVTVDVAVRTRPGPTIHATMFAYNPEGYQVTYYGATFNHTAAPSRPVVGVIRDRDTGKPLAGVTIQSDKFAGNNVHGDPRVRTVTDQDGRFRLIGMPKGDGNLIVAVPATGQPYCLSMQPVPDTPGLDPVTVDFSLVRGVLVRGRVLDKATREPVFGNIEYFAFTDNPRWRKIPGFTTNSYLQTGADGSFEVVALPGHGLLAARGWNDHYRMGIGTDRITTRDERGFILTAHRLLEPDVCHTYVEINPPEGAALLTCDVLLDPGRRPHGRLVDPDGKPLPGTRVLGLTAYNRWRQWTRAPLRGAEFTVWGLGDGEEREVVFVHEGRRLAGAVQLHRDTQGPLTVKLQPWGAVTGRLVTPKGEPRPGVLLRVADESLPNSTVWTDKNGRFRLEGFVPGVSYTMEEVRNGAAVRRVFTDTKFEPGRTKDLGDIAK
jgi:RNA polymerase sigma factor (sigma-70 family)